MVLGSLRFQRVESYRKMKAYEDDPVERQHETAQKLIDKILRRADRPKRKPGLRIRLKRFGIKVRASFLRKFIAVGQMSRRFRVQV
ncbi:hypothetical protein SUGI_0638520 [Cryptomeria japonica]|nr:hypothetical protein SUGI_0638520 [Cryptomeria japonica]